MRQKASYDDMIESRWWQLKAVDIMMATDDPHTIGQICSLIPHASEQIFLDRLKTYSNLDALSELAEARRAIAGGENAEVSIFIDDAENVWQALQLPATRAVWDTHWQLPESIDPDEIAEEILAVVYRAVFRVPLFDLVKCALEYKALLMDDLLKGVYDIHHKLQLAVQDQNTREIYIKVEKILRSRPEQIPIAHRILISNPFAGPYLQEAALALMLNPVKDLFAKRDLRVVLKRLAVLDQGFTLINQSHEWDKWSVDLDFVERAYQVLWMANPTVSSVPAHLPSEDGDKKVQFLRSLVLASGDQDCRASVRSSPFIRIFRRMYDTVTSKLSCLTRHRGR